MAKKYFWLKLKDDFFNQKEIKMLRKLAGGDTYTVIYLKMLLLSLKNEGKIYFDGIAENMIEEISLDIDESVENVQVCFNYLHQKGLIEFYADDEVELTDIASMIGSETDSARRKRKQRLKENRDNVTKLSQGSHTEIELEKEIEKEQESEIKIRCYRYFEQNGFGMLSGNIMEQINVWLDDFEQQGATSKEADNLIIKALEIADDNGIRKWNYARSILNNWYQQGLTNTEQVDAVNNEHQEEKQKVDEPDTSWEELFNE